MPQNRDGYLFIAWRHSVVRILIMALCLYSRNPGRKEHLWHFAEHFWHQYLSIICSAELSDDEPYNESLREKCPNAEVFFGPYFAAFGLGKTPYLDTFHALSVKFNPYNTKAPFLYLLKTAKDLSFVDGSRSI